MVQVCRDWKYACCISKSQPWLWQNQVPVWSGIRRFLLELRLQSWLPPPCSLLTPWLCELSLTRFSQIGEGFCNAEKIFFGVSCLRWVAVWNWGCKGRHGLLLEGRNRERLHDRLRQIHRNAPERQSPDLLRQQRMRSEMKGTLCYFSLPWNRLQCLFNACYLVLQRVMFYKQILNIIMLPTEKGKVGKITQLKMSP